MIQLTGMNHHGTQALEALAGQGSTTYRNSFFLHALGAYSWRPQSKTKPLMDGPQIAHIVGPPGEEIYCDEHGRVKVQFPWDREGQRNEHASCWIRVSQGWAGAGWGAMAIPRIGQEVIVDFLEGDPDQPIITGRTYHAANVPPYPLPAHKTRMSIKSRTHKGTGFNELRFDDEKDKEEVFIHAQKDQNNVVLNDETTRIGRNRTENVGKNEQVTIGENLTVTVTRASRKKAKSIVIEAADFIELNIGGSSFRITPSGIVISAIKVDVKGHAMVALKGGLVKINPGGAAGGSPSSATTPPAAGVKTAAVKSGGFNKTQEDALINDPPLENVPIIPIEMAAQAVVDVIASIKAEGLSAGVMIGATIDTVARKIEKVVPAKKVIKEIEAFGERAIVKFKKMTGKDSEADFNRRYQGPDDLLRNKNKELEELEVKATTNPKSKPLPKQNNSGKQGSAANNARRGEVMGRKQSKAGKPSKRIGGPYTQKEVDLWKEIRDGEGQKKHTFIRANQATNKAEVYEQDKFGTLSKKIMEFTVDD